MKQCMHCGRNYDGHDGDMIDCPYCGEYGGNSWVYGGNGHKHAFSWETSPGGSSGGSSGDGCAAGLGFLFFLLLIPGRVMSCLWGVAKFIGIVFGCWLLIIGLILLWDKNDSAKKRDRPKTDIDDKCSSADASSSRASSTSFLPAKAPSHLRPRNANTITVTDRNYYRS